LTGGQVRYLHDFEERHEETGMASDTNTSPGGAPQPAGGPADRNNEPDGQSPFDVISRYIHPGRENVMLIYVLFLAGLFPAFGAVPIVVGFVLALLNRSEASGIWASHYEFQYRTAAIGLLFVIVSAVLVLVVIGVVGLVLTAIWWIVRAVKGLQAASREQAVADPKAWSW
jgi:uncharacterized membrane protein